jgi:transposase
MVIHLLKPQIRTRQSSELGKLFGDRHSNLKLMTEVLDLDGIRVVSHQQYPEIGRILKVESTEKVKRCPRCSKTSRRIHQNHHYIVKDLPWGDSQIFLEINRRQFKCDGCKKPFSEELDFIKPRRKYTKRLAQKILEEVKDKNVNVVAKKGIVTTEKIEKMLKDAATELCSRKPKNLKRLGIDKIALTKGKGNYCAFLVDLDKSLLIGILPDRTQDELNKTFLQWGSDVLEQIE